MEETSPECRYTYIGPNKEKVRCGKPAQWMFTNRRAQKLFYCDKHRKYFPQNRYIWRKYSNIPVAVSEE